MTSGAKETEIISLRATREFKEQLRTWADERAVSMAKLLEEMGDLYTRAGAERKLSMVELLMRPHVQAMERELSRAFEESEGKGGLYREEAEALRTGAATAEERHRDEKRTLENEIAGLKVRLESAERFLAEERLARETAERQAREATDTARALTASLNEARGKAEEREVQLHGFPKLQKEHGEALASLQKVAMERESAELMVARLREDLAREKEAGARGNDTYRRELLALEREFEARVSKLALDAERSLLQKTTALERQIQTLQGQVSRQGEGTTS